MRPLLTRSASTTLAAALAALLPLAACQNTPEPTAPSATSPRLAILDAAHGIGGDPRFVWLPPTVPTTPAYSGTFASGLSPTVTVCYGALTSCPQNTVAHFTRTDGTGGALLAENTTSPSYRVTWVSSSCDPRIDPLLPAFCPLTPGQIYRMTVTMPSGTGDVQLGYADIKIYRTLIEQYQDPARSQFIPLLQNRPLGIAFRIAR
jgi:hypothetical protein